MRCTIIGTSNSIMKASYRPFIERSDVFKDVRNLSIGGTPNILLPYMLARNSVDSSETVVLETSVNDTWCIQHERLTLERVVSVELEVINYLNSLGIKPILLVMPTVAQQRYIDEIRSFYYRLERAGKAKVLDGYPILWALQKETGHPFHELFLDDGHVVTHVAAAIANRLVSLVRASNSRRRTRETKLARKPLSYCVREVSEFAPRAVRRASSLHEHSYGILESGEELKITFDTEVQLQGVSFNSAGSSAVVEIATDCAEPMVYDFRCVQEVGPTVRHFTHALAPLPTVVAGCEFRLRVLPESEVKDRSIVPLGHAKFGNANAGRLEIEALVLHTASPTPARGARRGCDAAIRVIPSSELPGPVDLNHEERMIAQLMVATRNANNLVSVGRLFNNTFHGKRDFSRDAKADLMRDIGHIALQAGNDEIARKCLSLAIQERPNGSYIRKLLEKAQSREKEVRAAI